MVTDGEIVRSFARDKDPERIGTIDEVLARQQANKTYLYRHVFCVEEEKNLPSLEAICAVAKAMQNKSRMPLAESDVPAGYTYLGQFIFHDISFMDEGSKPHLPVSNRTPALDLDSVHKPTPEGGLIPIGWTFGSGSLQQDVQRREMFTAGAGCPLIVDRRNDDFLPLAQCHLVVSKFFNAVATKWGGYDSVSGIPPASGWDAVRRVWLQHFQSVVLHDYLPRIVDRRTYADVLTYGRQIVAVGSDIKRNDWFPVEFPGAIGRFGHSMIRDDYDPWNWLTEGIKTPTWKFMEFSYANSRNQLGSSDFKLPTQWVTNWYRLFDLSGTTYDNQATEPMKAALIDTNLADDLSCLPSCLLEDMCHETSTGTFVLANETLKRGLTLKLASAQRALCIANSILKSPIPELSHAQIAGPKPELKQAFADHPELLENTPLWYYVLREAEYFTGGYHLGPFGSRIVMETLHAAIAASDDSILSDPDWRPQLPSVHSRRFTMSDLIAYAGDPNPLGAET